MGIEWYRDLFLIIFTLTLTVVGIFLAVVAYRFYRRASVTMKLVGDTARTIHNITSIAGEQVFTPLAQVAAIIQGVRQGIQEVNKLFGKQKGGENG